MTHQELRKRFNPDGSPLRRQQMRMLHLLKEVDRICQQHDIRYWLSSGTLIGAIRHNGFIPWDDDLDIEMMREDYLRLMKVLPKELPTDMALQNHETDPAYFFCYAKVRDRHSRMSEGNHYDRAWKEQGIYIDIFPLERQRLWIHKLSEMTIGHNYKIWRTRTDDEKNLRKVQAIFKFNQRIIHPFLRFLCTVTGSKTITSGLGIPYHNPRYMEDIFPLAEHVFEGHLFPIPHHADHLLKGIYGDYMQLPDIDHLHPHTEHIDFNKE